MSMKTETRSKFLTVKCNDCGNEQTAFGSSSMAVKCLKCGHELVVPRSGKAEMKGKVLKVLG